ncbi:MAG: sulfurtransferase complex subunit TusB [Promethearchaeota archaeon]
MSKILFFITCMDKTGCELVVEQQNEADQVSICLLQNAVYSAMNNNSFLQDCIQNKKIYAVAEDVKLRGIDRYIHEDVNLIDYAKVIDLVFEQDNIISI